MPNTDHPVIPQNLYRMSGGATNTERFEQVGQSWLKHAFAAGAGQRLWLWLYPAAAGLGPGCSDPYGAGLNASQSEPGFAGMGQPFYRCLPIERHEITPATMTRTEPQRIELWSTSAT